MKYFRKMVTEDFLRLNLSQKALTIITLLTGTLLIAFSNYLYVERIASFRFVDEYTNMAVGHLMKSGRILYQQIFFHHHPLPVIMSSFMQQLIPIHSLYELVKFHRYLSIGFSLAFGLFLLLRFRMNAIVLITFYEVLKYYIFGYQYLAETFIAYPIAYMTLLVFETESKKGSVRLWEIVFSGVLTWWIIFQREPYALLAVFLFIWIVRKGKSGKNRILALTVFAVLSAITLASLSLTEYFRQIFVLNSTYAAEEVGGSLQPFIQGVTYLFGYIVTGLQKQHMLYMSLGVMSLGSFGVALCLYKTKKWMLLGGMAILLILAGIRNPELGSLWYNMYRAIPHIIVLLCIVSFYSTRPIRLTFILLLAIGMIIAPSSHYRERRDNANEFYINYSETDGVSQVITAICKSMPSCKLHVDGEDSLVYWQTKLDPWFEYGVFYNVQEGYLDYAEKRRTQFALSPPDVFYRTECKVRPEFLLTVRRDDRFVPLMKEGSPSCIWITKDLASKINTSQRESITKHGYSLSYQGN